MPKAPAIYSIDSTPHSAVVICRHSGCTWRGASNTKPGAYRLVSAHLRHVHHDRRAANNAAYYAETFYTRGSQAKTARAKVSA